MRHGGDIQRGIRCRCCRADWTAEITGADQAFAPRRSEYIEVPASRSKINLPIRDHRRGPDFALDIVRPVRHSGFRIEAMELPSAIGNEYQPTLDGRRGKNMFLQWIRPN